MCIRDRCYSKSVNKTYKCKIKQLENDICEIEKSNYEKIDMNKKRKLESELKELIKKKKGQMCSNSIPCKMDR